MSSKKHTWETLLQDYSESTDSNLSHRSQKMETLVTVMHWLEFRNLTWRSGLGIGDFRGQLMALLSSGFISLLKSLRMMLWSSSIARLAEQITSKANFPSSKFSILTQNFSHR